MIVQCQVELFRLLKCNPRLGEIISADESPGEFDFHCPLLSLPRAFNTDIQTIPAATPYLGIDRPLADAWEERLASAPRGYRVGLVWAGRPTHKRDRQRSIALSHFLPLAEVGDVTFFSLQKGEASEQVNVFQERLKVIDLTNHLLDFAQTAALISKLDLVIGVDTAVVHLAEGHGKTRLANAAVHSGLAMVDESR